MSIAITVGMPMFRSKYIAWLALEGLIRQEQVDFEWELLAIEEQDNSEVFGEAEIRRYEERLRDVGCVDIVYKKLPEWIPLGSKLKMIGELARGKIYAGNADDYYPAPLRLRSHYDALMDTGYDIFLPRKVIYYSIAGNVAFMRDMDKSHRVDDVAGRAVLSEFMRFLKTDGKVRGCDRACHASFAAHARRKYDRQIKVIKDDSDNWKYGLSTFGFNNISVDRIKEWGNDVDKVLWPEENMKKYIPSTVLERLIKSKNEIPNHKRIMGEQ